MDVGTHEVEVIGTSLGESKGNLFIEITFKNVAGEYINAYRYTSVDAYEYCRRDLTTLGWEPAAHANAFERLNDDPSPLAGARAQIVVEVDTYEKAKQPNKVRWINKPGGGVKRLDKDQAHSLAEMLRMRLSGRVAELPAGEGGGGGSDDASDDIPFASARCEGLELWQVGGVVL